MHGSRVSVNCLSLLVVIISRKVKTFWGPKITRKGSHGLSDIDLPLLLLHSTDFFLGNCLCRRVRWPVLPHLRQWQELLSPVQGHLWPHHLQVPWPPWRLQAQLRHGRVQDWGKHQWKGTRQVHQVWQLPQLIYVCFLVKDHNSQVCCTRGVGHGKLTKTSATNLTCAYMKCTLCDTNPC